MRLTFDSNFAYPIRVTMAPNRQRQQRPGVPVELVKEVKVEFLKEGKTVASAEITDNHQRLCRIDVEPVEADTIRITPVNTHGAEKVVLYEARVYS